MAMLTVRNLPDEVHHALKARAASRGHSTEAEVRAILADAVKPAERIRLGSLLASIGQEVGLTDEEFAIFENVRDRTSTPTVDLE